MTRAEEKPYGIRGTLNIALKDVHDDIPVSNNMIVSVRDNVMAVGYEDPKDKEKAELLGHTYCHAWTFRTRERVSVAFNAFWQPDENKNKTIGISLHDTITAHTRIQTTVVRKGLTFVVKQDNDSYSFLNDTDMVAKALRDNTLAMALGYYHEEVLDPQHAMSGIHKVIEQITYHLDPNNITNARLQLAIMAGVHVSYIHEVMETVQERRHSEKWWFLKRNKAQISLSECIDRVQNLLRAYANSLP